MDVRLTRVDERLVHGQVITSWTRQFEVKKIIVIDDELASDEFMVSVLSLAAPAGVEVIVKTVDEAVDLIGSSVTDESTMLLFKSIKYALKLVEAGYEMTDLDIGNIGSGPKRKAISKRVYMTDEEMLMAKELVKKGVNVYLQMLYSDSKVDILTLI